MRIVARSFCVCVLVFSLGCRNFESSSYYEQEHLAYRDLISEMAWLPDLLKNGYGNSPTLYIINPLTTDISIYQDSVERIIGKNGENIIVEKEISPETLEEQELFKAFLGGNLKERKLDERLNNEFVKIKTIPGEVFDDWTSDGLAKRFTGDENLVGYLILSRIAFDSRFRKGYMSYAFYCGEGCAWHYNVEIIKENGIWKISRVFSGGIA